MQTKISDLFISSASIISIQILGITNTAELSDLITTGCQVAIAAATIYRLIKDKKKN
jgi:hypothetical protein